MRTTTAILALTCLGGLTAQAQVLTTTQATPAATDPQINDAIAPLHLDCDNASTVASFSYPGNPSGWLLEQTHYSDFNHYASGPCADVGVLDFSGSVGHSGGSVIADGTGMICTGGWDTTYEPWSGNDISFDVTFDAGASGNLDTFCFDWAPFNGTSPTLEGFELNITDSNGATVWSSGQQDFTGGLAGTATTECFDISSVYVSGGETLTFQTYAWGTGGAYLGGWEVGSNGALCVCPEPSAALLSILGAAGFLLRRRR